MWVRGRPGGDVLSTACVFVAPVDRGSSWSVAHAPNRFSHVSAFAAFTRIDSSRNSSRPASQCSAPSSSPRSSGRSLDLSRIHRRSVPPDRVHEAVGTSSLPKRHSIIRTRRGDAVEVGELGDVGADDPAVLVVAEEPLGHVLLGGEGAQGDAVERRPGEHVVDAHLVVVPHPRVVAQRQRRMWPASARRPARGSAPGGGPSRTPR